MDQQIRTIERSTPWPSTNGDGTGGDSGMLFNLLNILSPSKDLMPEWWSPGRDQALREMTRRIDPLKIASSTFISKVISIPMRIGAKDTTIKRHVEQAARLTESFQLNSGIGQGWDNNLSRLVSDWLTQDNGAFAVVMGRGNKTGPIVGPAIGITQLDSGHCKRTGDAEYPVVYQHTDGKNYKLHHTRVIRMSNMPSPEADMNGVGYCAVSNCLDAARELKDIYVNSQESFGSRPARRALYIKKGATLEQLTDALVLADQKMDSNGLTRFAKTILMAPNNPALELELGILDLAGAPSDFNRMEVTMLDMALLASSFGLDLYDLAMTFAIRGKDETAEVSDRKGWGKGVGQFIASFKKLLDFYALPSHLFFSFDNIDDQQDEYQAGIRNTRSQARERDLQSGIVTVRVERERMLRNDEITREEFAEMELVDGRLPNGLDLFSLFSVSEPSVEALLNLGVDDPTDVKENDPEEMTEVIHDHIQIGWVHFHAASTSRTANYVKQAIAALERLLVLYEEIIALEAELALQDVPPDTNDMVDDGEAIQSDVAEEEMI